MELFKTKIFAKRFFAFPFVLVLVVALLPSMAFAQTPSTPDFSDQPVPHFASQSDFDNSGFLWATISSNPSYIYTYGSLDVPCYVFVAGSTAPYTLYVCWESFTSDSMFTIYKTISGHRQTVSSSTGTLDSDSNLRYVELSQAGIGTSVSMSAVYVPSFSSVVDGLAAVRDFIDNSSSAPDTRLSNYSLPAGNAIFIEYDYQAGDYLGISGEMVDLSVLFPNADNFFPFATQKIALYSGSIPSSFGEPASASMIKFQPRGARNLLGQYTHGYYELDTALSGKNIVYIANPYYSAQPNTVIGESGMRVNNPIQISMDHVVDFKVFGLRSTVTINIDSNNPLQDTVEHSYTGNGTEYFGGFGEDGTAYTVDDNGNVVAPIPGAGSDQVQQSSLQQWLSGISDQIAQFFNGSINAITNLVSGASDFVGNFASLYSWLPPPVLSILQSALIIAITIGVIKVFL